MRIPILTVLPGSSNFRIRHSQAFPSPINCHHKTITAKLLTHDWNSACSCRGLHDLRGGFVWNQCPLNQLNLERTHVTRDRSCIIHIHATVEVEARCEPQAIFGVEKPARHVRFNAEKWAQLATKNTLIRSKIFFCQ